MNLLKCEICGGTLKLHLDSLTAVCDSCGNTTEIAKSDCDKYRLILQSAERQMRLGSVASLNEAIKLLESIRFVDGVSEKIADCHRNIAELQKEKTEKEIRKAETDSDNTKIGIALLIITLVALLICAVGIGLIIYKIAKDGCPPAVMYIGAGLIAVSALIFIVGKIKEN